MRQEFALGLTGGEELEIEFDRQSSPPDHWLACQDFGIYDNSPGQRHTDSLPREARTNNAGLRDFRRSGLGAVTGLVMLIPAAA